MKNALFWAMVLTLVLAGCGDPGPASWWTIQPDSRPGPAAHPDLFFEPAQGSNDSDRPLKSLCNADGQPVPMAVLLPCRQTAVKLQT